VHERVQTFAHDAQAPLADVPSVLVTLTWYLQHRRMDWGNTPSMPLRDARRSYSSADAHDAR